MLQSRKNKSVVSILIDRELNNRCAPYFLSLSVVSHLLRSDCQLFNNYWKRSFLRPVTYDSGYLYTADYTRFCALFAKITGPNKMLKLEEGRAKKKISDVISYTIPIYKSPGVCNCGFKTCYCLSQCLLSVTEDNWLCQHLMCDGKLLREFYVNRNGFDLWFKYCDWDVYGERFVLTSTLNPDVPDSEDRKHSNVVVNLAIFHTFPFEFFALFEITRSVFGSKCVAANLSDQHLIIGLGNSEVNIYNFDDFISEGEWTPYKLGQSFGKDGKVGFYPTGLPLNFTYTTTPPVLFNVQCFGQIIRFGGYPYHYITSAPRHSSLFTVRNIETNVPAVDGTLVANIFNELDALVFHPDHSNRLLFKGKHTIDCYDLIHSNGISRLQKSFSMGFPAPVVQRQTTTSSGRKIKYRAIADDNFEYCIYCTDYSSELDLFALMGVKPREPSSPGFIKLYDSFTGAEIRTVVLKEDVSDNYFYQLYVDMCTIILTERREVNFFSVHVYNM